MRVYAYAREPGIWNRVLEIGNWTWVGTTLLAGIWRQAFGVQLSHPIEGSDGKMSCEPVSRRYAHSEGATHLIFNSKRYVHVLSHEQYLSNHAKSWLSQRYEVLRLLIYYIK